MSNNFSHTPLFSYLLILSFYWFSNMNSSVFSLSPFSENVSHGHLTVVNSFAGFALFHFSNCTQARLSFRTRVIYPSVRECHFPSSVIMAQTCISQAMDWWRRSKSTPDQSKVPFMSHASNFAVEATKPNSPGLQLYQIITAKSKQESCTLVKTIDIPTSTTGKSNHNQIFFTTLQFVQN